MAYKDFKLIVHFDTCVKHDFFVDITYEGESKVDIERTWNIYTKNMRK